MSVERDAGEAPLTGVHNHGALPPAGAPFINECRACAWEHPEPTPPIRCPKCNGFTFEMKKRPGSALQVNTDYSETKRITYEIAQRIINRVYHA